MKNINNDVFTCSHCNNQVKQTDDFCPNCGSLFAQNVHCDRHHKKNAEGVCVICCLPYCKECGAKTNGLFLCDLHAKYEIYEGMVRIFGSLNDTPAQHAKSCLEQGGYHPLLYCRAQAKGGPRFVYTLFRAAGDFDGHIFNEIKVMVPCQEVIQAEKLLKKLKIAQPSRATA